MNPFPLMYMHLLFACVFILASKDNVAGEGALRLNFYTLLPESNHLDVYCNESEYLCRIQATFCVRFGLSNEMFHCDSPNIELVSAGVYKVGENYGLTFDESIPQSGQYVLLNVENDFDGKFEIYSRIETYNTSLENQLYSHGYHHIHIQSSEVTEPGVIQDTLGPHRVNITFSYELICSDGFTGMYCNIECSSVPCIDGQSPNIFSPLNMSTIVVNISTSSYSIINCKVTGDVDGVYWLNSNLEPVSNDHMLFIGLQTLYSISEEQTFYCYAYNENELVYITVYVEVVGLNRTTIEVLNDFREGISEEEYLDEENLDFFNEYLLSATGELYDQLEHDYSHRLSESYADTNLQFDDSYYFSEQAYQELYDISYTYQSLVGRFTTNYNVLQQRDITTSLLNTANDILRVSTKPTKVNNQTASQGSYLFVTEATNMAFNALESISVNLADNIETYQESNSFSLVYGSISVHARHWLKSELSIDQPIQLEYSSEPSDRIVVPIELINQFGGSNGDVFSIAATIVDTHTYSKFEATNEVDSQIASQTVQIVLPRNYTNTSQSPFSMPIKITFNAQPLDNSSYEFTCVFLNTTTLQWSTSDITTGTISNQSSVDCYTTHLTNFAVLVSPYKMNKYDFNYIASDYFGYVLGSLSTICLILSLILFLAAGKNFFRIEANVVYFNCCLAMFIAMTLYLFTSRTFAFNRYLCMATAFLLHYTWLALFSWMLCIGLLILYSVTIGTMRKRRIYPILFIIGWILPMIIPIVTLGVGFDRYIGQNQTYCFISPQLVYAFIGPVYVIIFINFVIFCITMQRIFFALKKTNNYKTSELSKKTIITGFTLTPILGLPWGFTIIGLFTDHSVLHWLHAILSGSLGIVFFFVVVLLNDEVQELLCKTRTRRKRRLTKKSFISSNSNSTPVYRPRARNSKLQKEESMNQTTPSPTHSITKIPEEIQEDHPNIRDVEVGEIFSNVPSSSNENSNCITQTEQIL